MSQLDQALAALIQAGATPEEIVRRTRKLATKPVKDHFLDELLDPQATPPQYCLSLSVSDWTRVHAFFRKPTSEQYHPQRIFQDIASDVAESIALEDPQALVLALMLGAKAVQP